MRRVGMEREEGCRMMNMMGSMMMMMSVMMMMMCMWIQRGL